MKRYLLILVGCIYSLVFLAEDQVFVCDPDSNLNSALSCINRGEFDSAIDTLQLVNNWQFCAIGYYTYYKEDSYLDHPVVLLRNNQIIQFFEYLESHPISEEIKQQLLLYYQSQLEESFRDIWIYLLMQDTKECYRGLLWTHTMLNNPKDNKYAKLLTDAGINAYEWEYYSEAIPYLTEANELWSTIVPQEDSIRQLVELCLGSIYLRCGDYSKAELNLKQTISDSVHYVAGIGHLLLGELYMNLGDYKQSELHLQQAIRLGDSTIYKQALASASYMTYKKCRDSVFNHYFDDYISPIPSHIRNESYDHIYNIILKKHDNSDVYLLAPILDFYDSRNLIDESIIKYEKILASGIGSWTGDRYTAVKCSNLLGWHFYQSGLYIESLNILLEGKLKAEITLDDSPHFLQTSEYSGILRNLIRVYHAMELPQKAKPFLEECATISKRSYINSVSFLLERQREQYWEVLQQDFEDLYPFFEYRYYNRWPDLAELAYDNELFTKGLLLASTDAITRSIAESKDSTLIRQWEELTQLRRYIIALHDRNSNSQALQEYEHRADSLEKIITINSAAYRENMRQWGITWDSVRAVLKPKQVAIEFMRAPLNEDSTMYCALLLRHDSDYPELIPLFEEKQVTKLLHTSTYEPAKINKTYQFGLNGDTLTRLIWGNILPYIHKGEEIYISPTHLLHQIAIEHLPYDETHTMNEVYSIVRLSSTRELVLPEKPIPHKKATLYGGIDYKEQTDATMAFNMKRFARRDMSASQRGTQRQLHGKAVDPLDGTQTEVDTIESILKGQRITVKVYSDFSACEESVKGLSGQKQNILHFATHGKYVDTLTTNDPLDRCMLVFAGANRALTGGKLREDVDDGLLSAKEISVLDFREADIVVMSACETGLGDVSGEGVFGLQRAFKMAGAQTILMALWQVDDNATQMLMTAFYRYYSKGISKREAFRKAQQEVRNYTETKTVPHYTDEMSQEERMANQGKIVAPKTVTETITEKPYEAPYFWAGFILLD